MAFACAVDRRGKRKRGRVAHLSDMSSLTTVKDSDTCNCLPDPGRYPRDYRGLESSRQHLSIRSRFWLVNMIFSVRVLTF